MLAKRVDALPKGDAWVFEPKWDGFRALVFRDGAEVLLQSRDEKPLNRYFPELEGPLRATLPERCVLDGEIVLVQNSAGRELALGEPRSDSVASPSRFSWCGGHGASSRPDASSRAASSKRPSSDPGAPSVPACKSPSAAKRAGMVRRVKSSGSHASTSSHRSGAETRASGSGLTEYAEQVVRSFAFWS